MNTETLLAELEDLNHPQRVRRMVEIGRAGHPELLAELASGNVYQRGLALQACYGSRDPAQVLRFCSDRSAGLRGLARRLAVLCCSDEQLAQLLDSLGPRHRHRLLLRLVAQGRRAAVDAWFASQTRDLHLLPYCSTATVRQHLTAFADGAGEDEWARLARMHPGLARDWLLEQVRHSSAQDNRLLWACQQALLALIDADPDGAGELAVELARRYPLSSLPLAFLALRRPGVMARLLLEHGGQTDINLTGRVHELDPETLEQLVEHGWLRHPESWLERLAREVRQRLYERFGVGWRDSLGQLPEKLLQALPGPARREEARRHLNLAELATRPLQRLPYAALLDFDEASQVLKPWLGDPDPDLRRVAVGTLIRSARYAGDRLGDALAAVRYRKNEQDPIRQTMLEALGDLPPGRWQAPHLEQLDGAFEEAFKAADLSSASAEAIARLVVRLLPFQPEWSARWLARLAQDRGHLQLGSRAWQISRRDFPRVAAQLLPVFKSWESRERSHHLIAAAHLLGPRRQEWPQLLDLLERLVLSATTTWVATSALDMLRWDAPERLDRLIPTLLKKDESWGVLGVVNSYLHHHRQDLLTPFLEARPLHGRHTTGRTIFVLPFDSGFHRWNPFQQELFADTLRGLTADSKRDTPTLRHAIAQLAALPGAPETLEQLSRLDNPRQAVRDLALQALARRDESDGLRILIEALGDERARIAIYAMRRALREAAPREALKLLQEVPLQKVTVAKEVIRLLGELPAELAYAELLRMDGQKLHRDVRVALLRALWDHLEDERSWPILERAAGDQDPAVAAGVVRIPADRISSRARARLVALLARLVQHPAPRVRLDTQQRLATLPLNDPEGQLLEPLRSALRSPASDERRAAIEALFGVYGAQNLEALAGVVSQLLPERQPLADLCQEVRTQAQASGLPRTRPLARAILTSLAADPLTLGWQARLTLAVLELAEIQAWLLATELHLEAMLAALQALGEAAPRAEDWDALEAALAAQACPLRRRLGLAALVTAAQPPRGWTLARRERLEAYRQDPDPAVASAAQFTFLSEASGEGL